MPALVVPDEELDDVGDPAAPSSELRIMGELGVAALQPLRLALNVPRLATTATGNGRIALLLPGWRAPEASVRPLARYLSARGHGARSWGLGTNTGDVERLRDEMVRRVRRTVDATGAPLNLIGWSLGGVIAREVAREIPQHVHRVVTYGTPVIGGPTYTVGASSFGFDECARINALQEHLDATDPIRVPITAIFTRGDRAVDWRACIDRSSSDVRMVEVRSGHVAMGLDPDVWLVAAEALAE